MDTRASGTTSAQAPQARSAVSRGKCMPVDRSLRGTGDTLSALRDSNRLLYDWWNRPAKVMRAEKIIMDE